MTSTISHAYLILRYLMHSSSFETLSQRNTEANIASYSYQNGQSIQPAYSCI
jgi:hypothetical protein